MTTSLTQKQASDWLNIGRDSVKRAKTVQREAVPESTWTRYCPAETFGSA